MASGRGCPGAPPTPDGQNWWFRGGQRQPRRKNRVSTAHPEVVGCILQSTGKPKRKSRIESVRLREIEYGWDGAFDHVETHRAEDLFKALVILNRVVEKESHIRKAVFKIKLDGEKKPRTVTIKAGNKSGYNRGEEATMIEDWLRARRFVVTQARSPDAQADSAVAIA